MSSEVQRNYFKCSSCELVAPYHSFGRETKLSKSLVLLEDAYVMQDPFCPNPKPLILGSHCTVCNNAVCMAQTCSIFYTKRFCLKCAVDNLTGFPHEMQQEIQKLASAVGGNEQH